VFGWLLVSGVSQPDYPLPDFVWYCVCISLCIVGCAIMIAADAQKYFTLRIKRGLITDGVHRYVRHPAYVGAIVYELAVPVLLASWWALIASGLNAILLILRTALEDRALQAELVGYADYACQVRHRLLPGIW